MLSRAGALTLYGLFDQPDAETLGFPIEAEEGLLVTFPADVVHEVRPSKPASDTPSSPGSSDDPRGHQRLRAASGVRQLPWQP